MVFVARRSSLVCQEIGVDGWRCLPTLAPWFLLRSCHHHLQPPWNWIYIRGAKMPFERSWSVTLPQKTKVLKKRPCQKEMCIFQASIFRWRSMVNWGGFGWKVSRKSSYPSPKFNGWSRWNLCRSNMFKNPTFVGPSRATKKVRISQRNPFLSRWFKPFFLCGKCMLLPRENRIHTKYTSWMSRCVWMIYIYDIYCIYIYTSFIYSKNEWFREDVLPFPSHLSGGR